MKSYDPNKPSDVRAFMQEVAALTSTGPIGAAQAGRLIEEALRTPEGKELVARARQSAKIAVESLGVDFSRVRVFTDDNAGQLSMELGAKAFTAGQNVYLGSEYSGGSGVNLIAHELTHVVQQGEAQGKK